MVTYDELLQLCFVLIGLAGLIIQTIKRSKPPFAPRLGGLLIVT